MYLFRKYIFILLILLSSFTAIKAQESSKYTFEDMSKVFSGSFVFSIATDKSGNLWASTRAGVFIYDGITLEEVEAFRKFELVLDLDFDENDLLWFKIETPPTIKDIQAVQLYDYKTSKFFQLEDKFDGAIFPSERKNRLLYAKNLEGDFYIYDYENFWLKEKGKRSLIKLAMTATSRPNFFNDIYIKQNQTTEQKIGKVLRMKNNQVIQEVDLGLQVENSLFWNNEFHLKAKRKDDIEVNLYKKDQLLEQGETATSAQADYGDFVFITFRQKIYKLDKETLEITKLEDEQNILKNNIIQEIYPSNDALWILTDNGVFRMYETKVFFNNYLTDKEYRVRKFFDLGNNEILVFTDKHIAYFNTQSKDIKVVDEQVRGDNAFLWNDNTLHLGSGEISFNYTNIYPERREISNQRKDRNKENTSFNSSFDADSIILIGSQSKLYYFNSKRKFLEYPIPFNNEVTNIQETSEKGTVFLFCELGLHSLNLNERKLKAYDDLKDFQISAVYKEETTKSNYWVSTKYGGLILWNEKTGIIKRWTKEDGLSDNNIHSAYTDKKGRLWMSSDAGINVLDIENDEITVLTDSDGFAENEMNRFAHLRLDDGTLFYGSQKGFFYFNPDNYQFQTSESPLYFKYMSYIDKNSGLEKKIEIGESFTREFVLRNNYISPKLFLQPNTPGTRQKVRYRLASQDRWNYIESNTLTLNNVTKSENLYLSKKTDLHDWSVPEIYSLIVPIPFYKQPWFYIAIFFLVAILSIIYLINLNSIKKKLNQRIQQEIKLRTKELSENNEKLKSTNQLNDQIFSIISHDLRSPIISLNNVSKSIDYLIEKEEYSNLKKLSASIEGNSKNVLGLVDNLLDWSKAQRLKIEKNELFNVNEIVKDIVEKQMLIFAEKSIEIDVKSTEDEIAIHNDKESLEIILRNVLTNATKFSPSNSKIHILVKPEEGYVSLTVTDNGIGFDEETLESFNKGIMPESRMGTEGETGVGLGLTLCKEICTKMRGEMSIGNSVNGGAVIKISLPNN